MEGDGKCFSYLSLKVLIWPGITKRVESTDPVTVANCHVISSNYFSLISKIIGSRFGAADFRFINGRCHHW